MTYRATIVIPLLRQRDEWLEQCVLSAAQQTVPCCVTVVTAQSTPASNLAVLDRIVSDGPNGVTIERQSGAGFADAINTGIFHAATDRIGLLLSDDWLSHTAVEECLAHDAEIVSTGLRMYRDGASDLFYEHRPSMAAFQGLSSYEERASYLKHFFLFQREPLRRIGGVDPDIGLTGPDDYDMVWTLLENGADVAVVPSCLYHYRDHDAERLTLRDREEQIRNLRRIFRKHNVPEARADELCRRKSVWFGRTIHEVLAEKRQDAGSSRTSAANADVAGQGGAADP